MQTIPLVFMNAASPIPENISTASRVFAAGAATPPGAAPPMLLNLDGVRVVNWEFQNKALRIVGYDEGVPDTTQGCR